MGRVPLIVFALLLCALTARAEDDLSHRMRVGQTKQEILAILGLPDHKESFTKSGRPIWGPEEEFWDRIPDGTRLEAWSYQKEPGQLNLYFLNGHDQLDYKAFAPKGRVYEAE